MKSDSWRIIDDCPSMVQLQHSLNFTGLLLLEKLQRDTTTIGCKLCTKRNIISIDLADEKWGEMEQPCYGEGDIILSLGVLGSDLLVFYNYKGTYLDVWVMKEYGVKESWTKMFTIKYSDDGLGNENLGQRCLYMANEGKEAPFCTKLSISVIYSRYFLPSYLNDEPATLENNSFTDAF
ncbi:F-box protein CPR1-like [Lycium barbarum]|uniref:F-box protein CPR1-like n=1 Tax=Lycium barbarum TaxID=112863 RepID=UPI00293E6671|nr:F-box protein CPR1-like [Lycium barbarum]